MKWEKIGAAMMTFGFILFIGVVGGVECDTLTLTTGLILIEAAIIIGLVGFIIADKYEYYDANFYDAAADYYDDEDYYEESHEEPLIIKRYISLYNNKKNKRGA